MIHTTAKTDVYEVTFLDTGEGLTEANKHPRDEFGDHDDAVSKLIHEYDRANLTVVSIIYVKRDGSPLNLYGARRYGL